MRSTIDTAAGDTLMNKLEEEYYNLMKEMALNNHKWSNERSQPKWVRGQLKADALTLLSTEVDVMIQRLDRLNVNTVS